MQVETIAIKSLVLDPNNARKHDRNNLDAIAGSLTQFGQRKPIVIDKHNVVVAGNGTVTAAMELGWQKIAAVRVPDEWTAEQIKAFALADNRTAELAEWNAETMAAQVIELSAAGIDVAQFGFEQLETFDVDLGNTFEALAKDKGEIEQITFTLHADQAATIRQALDMSKDMGDFGDTGNTNSNGNAIARIVELWLGMQNVG